MKMKSFLSKERNYKKGGQATNKFKKSLKQEL